MNPRERFRVRVRIAAGVTVLALAGVLWPPVLWAVAALLVYCAAIAAGWYAMNRLVRRSRRRRLSPVPEPRSNVAVTTTDD